MTAVADAGLRIDFLHELDFVRWPTPFLVAGADGRYRLRPDADGRLPLFFSLKASKPGGGEPTRGGALSSHVSGG